MLIRKNYFLYNMDKGKRELAGSARLSRQEDTWKLELQWKAGGERLLDGGEAVMLQCSDNEIVFSSVPESQPLQQRPQASTTAALQQSSTDVSTSVEQQSPQQTVEPPRQEYPSAQQQLPCQESLSAQQQSPRQESPSTQQSSSEQTAAPQNPTIPYWETIRTQCDRLESCEELGEVYRIGKGDFALLPEEIRHMLQNSFLIHGLMNYGYLILCRTEGERQEIRLGVPGVYYEKEKLVAEMFGFDSFWCQEKSDNGKFGYYLRIVV